MYITYYASNDSMGDTSPEACQQFRDWAKVQLIKEYPNYLIEVSAEPSLSTAATDDFDNEDEIKEFCHRLWDNCPWDWLS